MTALQDELVVASGEPRERTGFDKSLIVVPVIVVLGLGIVFAYMSTQTFDSIEARALEPGVVLTRLGEHLYLSAISTIAVMIIAVPIGIWLSRPRMARARPAVLAFAGFMQALPPFGLIVLLAFTPLGFGAITAIIALVLAALLPVLTNTVVGLIGVDRSIVEAARGVGLSERQTLTKVELPLAIPVVVAGVRVALVLNVGTATLATYIGAGGLGDIIDGMLKLGRPNGTLLAASLVAALALLVDWLAGLAEYAVRRRGA